MKPRLRTFLRLYVILFLSLGSSLQAKDTLQIDKALIGASDSWRDVTTYLQDQIENDALSLKITQPFSTIGGDPAPGRVKNLIVDYHVNGKPYRLFLEEQFPVAFDVSLPSTEAEAPGANPQAAGLQEVASRSVLVAQLRPQSGNLVLILIGGLSLCALFFSVVALIQVRQLKRASNTPPGS